MYLMRLLRFGRKVELMNIKDGIFINICLTKSAFFVVEGSGSAKSFDTGRYPVGCAVHR